MVPTTGSAIVIVLLILAASQSHAFAVIDRSLLLRARSMERYSIFPSAGSAEKVRELIRANGGVFFFEGRHVEKTKFQIAGKRSNATRKIVEVNESPFSALGVSLGSESEEGRVNKTCNVMRPYPCKMTQRVQFQGRCQVGFVFRPCMRFRQQLVDETCYRKVPECCENYKLGTSGYCELLGSGHRCGSSTLTSVSGTVTSPLYPEMYKNEVDCTWKIQGAANTRVIMKIVDIQIEDATGACDYKSGHCFSNCQFDYVRISPLTGTTTERSLCGRIIPKTKYMTKANQAIISFHSDNSNGGRGFKLVYNVVQIEKIIPRKSCTGGRAWRLCRRECALTCDLLAPTQNGIWNICIKSDGSNSLVNTSHINDVTCLPGCICPDNLPVWHKGKCIRMEDCARSRFKCGIPIETPTPKIIGGQTSRDGAWPWMVQITTNNQYSDCGATLVCSDWLITAAHCFLDKETWSMPKIVDRQLYWFHLGKYWKSDQQDGRITEIYRAKRVILHPNYDFATDTNDIALVELDGYAHDIDRIRPICLPSHLSLSIQNEQQMNISRLSPKFDDTCYVTGWGTTRSIGPTPFKLKELRMPIKPDKQCKSYKSYNWRKMICAGGEVDEDTCKGDSGGPFMCKRSNRWFVDGITSFGDDCGTVKPGGYTRVANYIEWIRDIIGKKCGKPLP